MKRVYSAQSCNGVFHDQGDSVFDAPIIIAVFFLGRQICRHKLLVAITDL
jgi:hypothetical protein